MLEDFTSRSVARRAHRAEQQRRHRRRQREHLAVYAVELGEDVLNILVRTGWLADDATGDKGEVSRAVAAMLNDAAKH